jgi:maltooligosyltrehalose synthase
MKGKRIRRSSSVTAIAEEILARRRIPVATYRLQFGPNLTFRDAEALVPYLSDLGMSDWYASPLLRTCSKHSHGYDIFRKSQPDLFREGDYLPLTVRGDCAEHIVAFARRKGPRWVLVAVPRLLAGLCPAGEPPLGAKVWRETVIMLPQDVPESWRNVFTGETVNVLPSPGMRSVPVRDVFLSFPVALLLNAFL